MKFKCFSKRIMMIGWKRIVVCILFVQTIIVSIAQTEMMRNPILSGCHPDPTICRVENDYYVCCSSFTWFPGLPIYHSRDLVHWELVSHVIDREGMVTLDGVKDKDGVWAPSLRHHRDTWYVFCNVSNGGNFFVTAKNVCGPWTNPIFIRNEQGEKMVGIDPDIFWDDDDKAYVLGNHGSFPGRKYNASTAIWIQEIDLATGILRGERTYISTGHAFNAKYVEAPHLYKIGKKYVLLLAEGGTDYNHSETVMTSDKLLGPYLAQDVNPVLSQRQMGHDADIQCVGHCDLVQTPQGNWYAVALGKRMVETKSFTRETFLCPVEIQNGQFIFNPGYGYMTEKIPRPRLPWTPLGDQRTAWYYERIPHVKFDAWKDDQLTLWLQPETIDSLTSPALVMRKTSPLGFETTVSLSFQTKRLNEQAVLVLYRNDNAYIAVLKTAGQLLVVIKNKGRKVIEATVSYLPKDVMLRLKADGLNASVMYAGSDSIWQQVTTVSLLPLVEDAKVNRFNGLGVGMYASSNSQKSKAEAIFSNFNYTEK